MKTHKLKCWPKYFEHLLDGTKNFEYRINDRDYQVGDTLVLREWPFNPKFQARDKPQGNRYTGRELTATVTYVLKDSVHVKEGYCVLSIAIGWIKSTDTPPPKVEYELYGRSKDPDDDVSIYKWWPDGFESGGGHWSRRGDYDNEIDVEFPDYWMLIPELKL